MCAVTTISSPDQQTPSKLLLHFESFLGIIAIIQIPFIFLFLFRATALLLSVSHLVLVTRNACHMSGSMDWIDQSLNAAEGHMVVLREAALASEPHRSLLGADVHREQAI